MLRAQTLVTLKEYHSALFDVNRLIELNPTSEVYQNLQTRLKTQLVHPQLTKLFPYHAVHLLMIVSWWMLCILFY